MLENQDANPDFQDQVEPASPSEEKTEVVETNTPEVEAPKADAEENIPFHKHPRWQARQREIEELRAQNEELMQKFSQIEQKVEESEQFNHPSTPEIPSWFVKAYGDDASLWSEFQTFESKREEDLRQKVIQEIKREEESKRQSETQWESWIEGQITQLQDEGKVFEKNALLKVMSEWHPVDDRGMYDFNKGYELLKRLEGSEKKDKDDKRKDLAADTTSNNPVVTHKRDYKTPGDLYGRSWYVNP